MTIDQYFSFLIELKENNDIYMLKKTIEANNNIFKVNFQDVKYLRKILKKVRNLPTKNKWKNENEQNLDVKVFRKKKPETKFLFINVLNTVKR